MDAILPVPKDGQLAARSPAGLQPTMTRPLLLPISDEGRSTRVVLLDESSRPCEFDLAGVHAPPVAKQRAVLLHAPNTHQVSAAGYTVVEVKFLS